MKVKNTQTVFVGVSGGVDSSVAALLLKNQGYSVVGVFIRTWTPDFIDCTWRDERRDAMRVCASLGIPYLECDAEEAYKKGVAEYMIEEYKKGNTPNPDVMCNREVKFGTFWNFAKENGADFIATGHYAKNNYQLPITNYQLEKGEDAGKDQSYFLWTLTQEDLEHTLFPIGHLQKKEVRNLALKYGLPTATKKDSQGVCFLGPLDMKEFLSHYIQSQKGDVIDVNGIVVGSHDGAVFFTLGERHGFTITKHSSEDVPLYVVAKDIEKNTITVGTMLLQEEIFSGTRVDSPDHKKIFSCGSTAHSLQKANWISGYPAPSKEYKACIRYHGEEYSCFVVIQTKDTASIHFQEPLLISKGQSVVVYEKDVCIGGGIVI